MLKLLDKYYTAPIASNAQKLIDYADKHPFAIMALTPMQCDAFDTIKREHEAGRERRLLRYELLK